MLTEAVGWRAFECEYSFCARADVNMKVFGVAVLGSGRRRVRGCVAGYVYAGASAAKDGGSRADRDVFIASPEHLYPDRPAVGTPSRRRHLAPAASRPTALCQSKAGWGLK